MKKVVTFEGMSCQHCVDFVVGAYQDLEFVSSVEVDLEAGTASLEVDEGVSDDVLAAVVVDAGFVLVGVS